MNASLKKLQRVLAYVDAQGVAVRELFALSEYRSMKAMAEEMVANDPDGYGSVRDATMHNVAMFLEYSELSAEIADLMVEIAERDPEKS